ncbi:hypothetical protein [[Clostridium] fimetarium]|uniref:Uncharacterized protein n=1 Tax=[Clostridium] fimetarium TaxID=99656 RepID=A0A1I0RFX9_9FIRM|nr:hypothetical protein [[Clostridium] fimetarium]SEW39678.1 hypothetical protein SAMN05421659_11537 [[Clostridium] fimetarium]
MKNKQIINSWNKIEPDDALKNRMLAKILIQLESEVHQEKKTFSMKKVYKPLAVCLLLAVVFYVLLFKGGNIMQNHSAYPETQVQNDNPKNKNPISTAKKQVFSGFVLTVYAAEVEGTNLSVNYKEDAISTVLTPKVEVLLANYSPLISSVPGLPFSFDFNDSDSDSLKPDSIKVTIDYGELLTWNMETGIVNFEGTSISRQTGDTLYWSPLIPLNGNEEIEGNLEYEGASQGVQKGVVEKAQITVTAMKDGKEIGKQTIYITEIDGDYYATVGELIIIA